MEKTRRRDTETAHFVKKTADITGVSTRQVYRVLNGDSENEEVMAVYMELKEGDNKLIQAVKELVPFDGFRNTELRVVHVAAN